MSGVTIERLGEVAILRLKRGVTNALGLRLVDDLAGAIEVIKGSGARGLIVAGGHKFFSIGIDLPELLELHRMGLADYWYKLDEVCLELFSLPIPTASAVAGHAVAGGTILALMTDHRLIAEGRKLMGLNEVRLGLPVPYLPALVLRQLLGDRASLEVVYRGELFDSAGAKALGLVDEVHPLTGLEAATVAKVSELAALPQPAFAAIKAPRVEEIRGRFEAKRKEKTQEFLDCWFSDQTQELLRAAAKKF